MANERIIYSDLAIAPGEYLSEVLESKGMSQAELGRRMGRPAQAINEIIKGDKTITAETALQLERTLAVPAHIWTGLESQYRLVKAKEAERVQLQQDIPLLDEISYRELVLMGCVKPARDQYTQVKELHSFFGVASLINMERVKAYNPAFRCSTQRPASHYSIAAWLRCGELRANQIETKAFSKEVLFSNLAVIKSLTMKPPCEFLPLLHEVLADSGVALVIIQHFRRTYANGATFWISPQKAVVMLSIRGKWADIFWFSLMHELGHIILHGCQSIFIEADKTQPDKLKREEEADDFASNQLIEPKEYARFKAGSRFSSQAIIDFADKLNVDPGLVVGRLQHDNLLDYRSMLNHLRKRFEWKQEIRM